MHIILVSDRLTTTRTLVLRRQHLVAAITATIALILGLAFWLSYMTISHAKEINLPFVQTLLQDANAESNRASNHFVRENLNAMAVRLGELQAQITYLDSLGERLIGLAGLKGMEPTLANAAGAAKNGRGGPLLQPTPLSEDTLTSAVDSLATQVETKMDILSLAEAQILEERIRKSQLPTSLPIEGSVWNASDFGWRVDPITGANAMHEGVDFAAEIGTPVKAAAAGMVINVEKHSAYGNMVEINHGNDFVTRYAHNSNILVQPGAMVKRGQVIAEVGNTGRTTGPHLHFEVRIKGLAQNPHRFLQLAQATAKPTKIAETRIKVRKHKRRH